MEHLLLFICVDIALICEGRNKASVHCSITASADKRSILIRVVARLSAIATVFSLARHLALTCLVI